MEHLGNDTDRGKLKYWKRNTVSTLFCLLQIYKYSRCRLSHGFIAPRPLYTGPLCPTCWNSFLPSSPEAVRTHRRERPLLAREGN
jgi:hypothetical protein